MQAVPSRIARRLYTNLQPDRYKREDTAFSFELDRLCRALVRSFLVRNWCGYSDTYLAPLRTDKLSNKSFRANRGSILSVRLI